MSVVCKAANYKTIIKSNRIIAYNELYNSNLCQLIISAVADMMLPDIRSFNVPLAIGIEVRPDDVITINKDLKVLGSKNIQYFIPKLHFEKWKKSYFVVNKIFIALELALFIFLLYIYIFQSQYNVIMGICSAVVLTLVIILCIKMIKQKNLVKKYDQIDFIF